MYSKGCVLVFMMIAPSMATAANLASISTSIIEKCVHVDCIDIINEHVICVYLQLSQNENKTDLYEDMMLQTRCPRTQLVRQFVPGAFFIVRIHARVSVTQTYS